MTSTASSPLSADESMKGFIYSLPDTSLGLLLRWEKFVVVSANCFSKCVDEVCELYTNDTRHGTNKDTRLSEREVAEVHDVLGVYVGLGNIPVRIDFSNEVEDRSQIVQRCQPVRNQENQRPDIVGTNCGDSNVNLERWEKNRIMYVCMEHYCKTLILISK